MGRGRSGRREPAISGRVYIEDLMGELPAHLKVRIPGVADRVAPLRFVLLRVFPRADRSRTVAWTRTTWAGAFELTSGQLDGHAPDALALEVFAGHNRSAIARHGRWTAWSATFGPGDGFDQDTELDRGMKLAIPWGNKTVAVIDPRNERPGRTDAGAAVELSVPTWRPFHAWCVISGMRSWLWGARRRHDVPWVPTIEVMYPSPVTFYRLSSKLLFLRQDGGVEFTMSDVAHEFGHVIFYTCADYGGQTIGGLHAWASRNPRLRLIDQLAVDFAEGYATFCGQTFLRSRTYRGDDGSPYDMERVGHWSTGERAEGGMHESACLGFGDWASSAYLYDLCDRAASRRQRDDDPLSLEFGRVHRLFQEFAERRRGHYLTLPDFHDFLCERLPAERDDLEGLLDQNHLRRPYREYHALAEVRANGAFPIQAAG